MLGINIQERKIDNRAFFREYSGRLFKPFAVGAAAGWAIKESVFFGFDSLIGDALSLPRQFIGQNISAQWNTLESHLIMGAVSAVPLAVCGAWWDLSHTKDKPLDVRLKSAARSAVVFGMGGFVGGGIVPQFN